MAELFGGGVSCSDSEATITNCILWNNTPDEIYGNSAIVSYSNIQGGYSEGTNIIDDNPLFIDPNTGDYHLQVGPVISPCIDAGTSSGAPDTDMDGNIRPCGAGYDMGAYEACPAIPGPPVVSGSSSTYDTTPTWTWTSAGDTGIGSFRYKLDNSNVGSGATETTATQFTPSSSLSYGSHTLYVQECNALGEWSDSGSKTITVKQQSSGGSTGGSTGGGIYGGSIFGGSIFGGSIFGGSSIFGGGLYGGSVFGGGSIFGGGLYGGGSVFGGGLYGGGSIFGGSSIFGGGLYGGSSVFGGGLYGGGSVFGGGLYGGSSVFGGGLYGGSVFGGSSIFGGGLYGGSLTNIPYL